MSREQDSSGQNGSLLPEIRRQRRRAALTLMQRNLGMALGAVLVVVCIWVLSFRLVTATYPTRYALLATGLATEEARLVRTINEMLN